MSAALLDALVARHEELKGKKSKKSDQKLFDATSSQLAFWKEIQNLGRDLFSKGVVAKPYAPRKPLKTSRILNIMLSDLHYGADLDPRVVPHKYGPVEEARRTACVGVQVADYKRQYRAETELYVHLMGDIIQGNLHDPRAAAEGAKQWTRALYNLLQLIDFWSSQFKKVTVFCTTGNHDRTKSRHAERGVDSKYDSEAFKLYQALNGAFLKKENVSFEIPLTPYYVADAFGLKGFYTHGDTVLNVGFPGNSINVDRISKQVNKINSALDAKDRYSLFGVGHVHVNSNTRLPGGEILVTNGPLVPPDEYALSIGLFQNVCVQQMWESVPGYIFGDSRGVIVDHNTDKDKSLDKIVKPCHL